MFGIGFLEICVIVIVALVFVGPKKLPEMMKQAGKFFVQVRRMSSEVKNTMDDVIHDAEIELEKEKAEKAENLALKAEDQDQNIDKNTSKTLNTPEDGIGEPTTLEPLGKNTSKDASFHKIDLPAPNPRKTQETPIGTDLL